MLKAAVGSIVALVTTRRLPLWFIRLTQPEYWSWQWLYLPIMPLYFLVALRARSLTFFSAVNPGIAGGGMAGERKQDIMRLIPTRYLPQTAVIPPHTPIVAIRQQMAEAGLSFPVIAKPDVGERGRLVALLHNPDELTHHWQGLNETMLLQQYIDLPLEAGVMYERNPSQPTGRATSVVLKGLLQVTGTGTHTLQQLVLASTRARFQEERLAQRYAQQWHQVIPQGEVLLLEPIGNHCRGTAFLNGNHLLGPQMDAVMNEMALQIPGFYFGRVDLRAASEEALLRGEFVVLELNGAGSEPGHIYDARTPLWEVYRVLIRHWFQMGRIAAVNIRRGASTLRVAEVWAMYQAYKRAHRPAVRQ